MRKKLVSVIMSEYNTDMKLLEESIKSILNQTYDNLELILIDDSGNGNLKNIERKFNNDYRIKIFYNKKNMGLVYSLNKAIKLSNGYYIARMDTDDYAYEDRLKKEVDFLEKNPEYDVVGGNADFYDGKNIWKVTNNEGEVTREDLLKFNPFIHPTVVFTRRSINEVGGYLDFKRCEDYATWIEFFVRGYKMYNIKDVILRYHSSILDNEKNKLKYRKGLLRMIDEEYTKLYPSKFQLFKFKAKKIVAGLIPNRIMQKYHNNVDKNKVKRIK